MWSWVVEFERLSTEEAITIVGSGYPSKEVANWMRSEWLREFLSMFYFYKLVKSEVKEV